MKRSLCAAVAIFSIAGGALAQPAAPAAPAGDPGVYQVLRSGDKDMTCDQLAGEANTLNAKILADQQAAQKKQAGSQVARGVGGAAVGGALRGGLRMGLGRALPGMGAIGGLAALTAADQAATATGQAIATSGQAPAAPSVTPEQQRMNRLLGLFKEKSC